MSKIEPVAWMRDALAWIGEHRYEPRKVVTIYQVEGAEPLFTEAQMQQAVAEAIAFLNHKVKCLEMERQSQDTALAAKDALLERAKKELFEDLQAFGPCDHSVGICNCSIENLIRDIDRELNHAN